MSISVRWRVAVALLVLPIVAAFAPVLYAQEAAGVGAIEGTVRTQGTSRAVEGALVHVVGANIDATTNADGVYRIVNVPARAVQLRIRMIGYAPMTKSVTVGAGSTPTVDFVLSASAVHLEAGVPTRPA